MTGAVCVAYLHPGEVSHSFSDSLMRLVAYDLSHEGRVIRSGGPVVFRCGPGGLIEARNKVMEHFLSTDCEWLFSVDSDMGFAPDTVDRLVSVADPDERPVVGGLCFALREATPDGMQGFRTKINPTLYQWGTKANGEQGFVVQRDYPANELVSVAGTGAACVLIHRSVGEAIQAQQGSVWYDRLVTASGMKVSEDLSFCYRVNQVGRPVFVHTGVRTTHHKSFWLAETDYWQQFTPPPASRETAVLVPAMRPKNAPVFMRTLRASTGLARAFAIVEADDYETADAWRTEGATILATGAQTFAKKINQGYEQTTSPDLFIVGDDVAFRPGWLDHAQHVADAFGAEVVGTNDLGNPRVTSGEHATHLLISRQYVDETGASWDGPGVVCHEGYQHWYVDDEIVTAAKQRGVWGMALGSVVEHLHPMWSKADHDEVYEVGSRHATDDRKRFVGRRGSFKHETAEVA
jgi:hypothetical protein